MNMTAWDSSSGKTAYMLIKLLYILTIMPEIFIKQMNMHILTVNSVKLFQQKITLMKMLNGEIF